jgi:phthalate 4,5-dioxygenase oxygenase subunit
VAAVKRFRDGGPAMGTEYPRVPRVKLASFEGVVPKSTDWRTLAVSDEELAMGRQAAE